MNLVVLQEISHYINLLERECLERELRPVYRMEKETEEFKSKKEEVRVLFVNRVKKKKEDVKRVLK